MKSRFVRYVTFGSTIAMLLLCAAWWRSYHVNDSLWHMWNRDEDLGRGSAYQVWSERGQLAIYLSLNALHDRQPSNRAGPVHKWLDVSLYHPDHPLIDSTLEICLRGTKSGFNWETEDGARTLIRRGPNDTRRYVGIWAHYETAVAFPYWLAFLLTALLPARAAWRWWRRDGRAGLRAIRPAAACRVTIVAARGITVATSWAVLAVLLLGLVGSRWGTPGLSYTTHEEIVRRFGKFSSSSGASFSGASLLMTLDGVMLMRYTPSQEIPLAWKQSGLSLFGGVGVPELARPTFVPSAKARQLHVPGFDFMSDGFVIPMSRYVEPLPGEMGPIRPMPDIRIAQCYVRVSYGWLIPAAAVLPARSVRRTMRRRRAKRWRKQRRCARCGYDLRATLDRCPECGGPAQ